MTFSNKMKILEFIACLVVTTLQPLHGEVEEQLSGSSEVVIHSDYVIPINREADNAIRLTLATLDCPLSEFLAMSGLLFGSTSTCSLDREAGVIRMNTSHENATLAVMIVGHIMLDLKQGRLTPQQFADQYRDLHDSPFADSKPDQKNKENKAQEPTPNQPSD